MKRAILFALFGASLVAIPAASIGSIDLYLDCAPDSVQAKVQTWQADENKAEIAALRSDDFNLCEAIRSVGEGAFETLFGKPSKVLFGWEDSKRSPSNYAIPAAETPGAGFSGLGYRGGMESRFFPISDIGGVLMFPFGDTNFVSCVVIYLKIDDKFVPLQTTNDFRARMDWDRAKLDQLKKWVEERAKQIGVDLHRGTVVGNRMPPEKPRNQSTADK